jgi:hypothetical protein
MFYFEVFQHLEGPKIRPFEEEIEDQSSRVPDQKDNKPSQKNKVRN